MNALHAVQVAVLAVAATLVFARTRTLLFRAPLAWAELEAEAARVAASGAEGVRRVREELRGLDRAWAAKLIVAALGEPAGAGREAVIAEHRAELARAGLGSLYPVVAVGRAAVPLALVNVILEISWALSGGSGLIALQKGLAARLALGHALAAMCIGLGTTALCVVAASVLRRQARWLDAEMARAVGWLDALDSDGDGEDEAEERAAPGAER